MTRLTEDMVIVRTKQSNLGIVKKLNCWGAGITDCAIVKKMTDVEVLALSVNSINTLEPFGQLKQLEDLYLRKNDIKDVSELRWLQNLPKLKAIWLDENPMCAKLGANYRATVIRYLPFIKKIDDKEVTSDEYEAAMNSSMDANDEDSRANDDYETEQYEHQSTQRSVQPQAQQNHNQSQYYDDQHSQHQHSAHQQQQQQPQQPQQVYQKTSSPIKEVWKKLEAHEHHSTTNSPPRYAQTAREPRSSYNNHYEEYYHGERSQYPMQNCHSQNDLTDWDDHMGHHNNQPHYSSTAHLYHGGPRRSAGGGAGGDGPERYTHRNGGGTSRENGNWSENRSFCPMYHRRPVGRTTNVLSAVLCLIKDLDINGLEVVEHAVRCRINEVTSD